MKHEFKVGDRVVGTDRSWEHRVGELGTIAVCIDNNIAVLWDGDEIEHIVFKDEIMLVKEKPMQKDNTPKLWRDMTPEEKGALLLAEHEGEIIEASDYKRDWHPVKKATWFNEVAYRIKPEPKRETQHVYVYRSDSDYSLTRIGTVDFIDGKPDLSSIKI